MVGLDTMTTLFVNHGTEVTLQRSGELLHQVDSEVVLTLGIKDFVLRAIGSDEEALITYLPPPSLRRRESQRARPDRR